MREQGFQSLFRLHAEGCSGGVLMASTAELRRDVAHAVVAGGAEAGLGDDLAVLLILAQEQGHAYAGEAAELLHEAFGDEYGFDAVFIGSGAGLPKFMGIEGESLKGVYSANEFLTRSNLMKAYRTGSHTPIQHGKWPSKNYC